jgi:hypothetical protein
MNAASFTSSAWLDCVVPIMSFAEETPEFPAIHGSGVLVCFLGHVYLVTARHCLGKSNDDIAAIAARLMISIEISVSPKTLTPEDYIQFANVNRPVVENQSGEHVGPVSEKSDMDLVALEVKEHKPGVLFNLMQRSVTLPPTGEWFEKTLALVEGQGDEVMLRVEGFPQLGTDTKIDYDPISVVVQGRKLIGRHVGPGPYPHTRSMEIMLDEGETCDLNGMSGSPVYMKVAADNYALVGMALNGVFPRLHFATVESLTKTIQACIGPIEDLLAKGSQT